MKKALGLAVLVASAFAAPQLAQAAEGSWMVRARALQLNWENESDAIPSLAVPKDAIETDDEVIPEFDITYFFTKNIAAELVLTYPQKQDVKVKDSAVGSFNAGSLKHLPPTLTLQYHFMPEGTFRPYVGAGINYTRFMSVDLEVPVVNLELDVDRNSIGGALQVGFDVKLADNWFLNVDVKKIFIETDVKVKATGDKVSTLKLDPLAIGVGVGYRF